MRIGNKHLNHDPESKSRVSQNIGILSPSQPLPAKAKRAIRSKPTFPLHHHRPYVLGLCMGSGVALSPCHSHR